MELNDPVEDVHRFVQPRGHPNVLLASLRFLDVGFQLGDVLLSVCSQQLECHSSVGSSALGSSLG